MPVEEFVRDGVWVTHARPRTPRDGWPALVFVHGGAHASWCWEHLLTFFMRAGWECLAFDWYSHGRSAGLPPEAFLRRGIGDVVREIGTAVGMVDSPPVLVGHSMGGAACLAYAAGHDVAGLVLLMPVVPDGLGAEPIPIAVDPSRLFGPVPLADAQVMFFPSLNRELVRLYHALLVPESPRAVIEASRWELRVDLDAIGVPALVFAGERDVMCPPGVVMRLARALGAGYVRLLGCGHDDALLADGCWQQAAAHILEWLTARFP